MLYIFAIIKRNHFKMYMFGVVGETHAHDYFEVISLNSLSKFIFVYMRGGPALLGGISLLTTPDLA